MSFVSSVFVCVRSTCRSAPPTSRLFLVLDVNDDVVEEARSGRAQRVEVADVAVHSVEKPHAQVLRLEQ